MSVVDSGAVPRQDLPVGALRSSASLQQVASGDATVVNLAAYAADVTTNCPYLEPSIRAGQTHWMRYRPVSVSQPSALEAAVFAATVAAAEQVRKRRAAGARLACAVLVMELDPGRASLLLTWPHWAVKSAYAPVGVMVGKFWPGRADTDRQGRPVLDPPLPLLALRAAIPPADGRLLPRTPRLTDVISHSGDDGRDVFAPLGGLAGLSADPCAAWPRVRSWAADQLEPEETDGQQ